jgi:hypothetical protein
VTSERFISDHPRAIGVPTGKETNMKKEKTLKTIAVRKPGPVRLTRSAVYTYGCCCCVRP